MFAINIEKYHIKYHRTYKNRKNRKISYKIPKNPKISYIFLKKDLSIVYSKYGHEYKKVFKGGEPIEILKILGLITNIEEYLKIYN